MEDLKPCPKCLKHLSNPKLVSLDSWSGYATCLNCQTSTNVYMNNGYQSWKSQAIEAWNRRASDEIKRN